MKHSLRDKNRARGSENEGEISRMPREIVTKPVSVDQVGDWDDEADVLVVGYGITGVCAALGALETGADVLVLERGGGSEGLCGGILYLGGGTPMQEAMGWSDTPAEMQRFLTAALGPGEIDHDKLALYCEQSVDHYRWLVDQGVAFVTGPDAEGTHLASPEEDGYISVGGQEYVGGGLVWTGGENAYPFDELVPAVPRGHIPRDPNVEGEEIYEGAATKSLLARTAESAIRVRYETTAERLIVDSDGSVVGVEGLTSGVAVRLKARGGVILATGGFGYSPEMLGRHIPVVNEKKLVPLGHGGQDGLGIRMGQAVGAGVLNMDAVDVTLLATPPLSFRTGILINQHGQRFVNEDTYFGRTGAAALHREDAQVYLLVDESIFVESSWLRPSWVADSTADLESEMGLPSDSLTGTVEYYNHFAAQKQDPLFHKREPFLQPIEGTFVVVDLRAEKGASAVGVSYLPRESEGPADFNLGGAFTLGGLHTTVDSEVVDVDAHLIDGLYAAGRASAGLAIHGYCSGISLGDASFFGRRAGQAAARRATIAQPRS
jgi:3-oxo-5alpha-steroid 4-dehydrogenase